MAPTQSARELAPRDRIAIEDLLTDISIAVDDRDVDMLGVLVTDDVNFDVGMGEMVGRDAVVAAFSRRADDTSYVARHLWSNLKILRVEGDLVHTRCVFATFAVTDLEGARNRVWRCGDYFDSARQMEDGSWKLASRKLVLALPD